MTKRKIDKFVGKLQKFKGYFPLYQTKKVCGCVAFLDGDREAIEYAQEKGLLVIKSTGGDACLAILINEESYIPIYY